MAIPSTANTTALFLTQHPAWEAGVRVEQIMQSDVVTSRSGLEQRQQRTTRGSWTMSYRAALSSTEKAAREIRAEAEIAALCWVPFWPEAGLTATTIVSNTLSIDREWSPDFFAPGDWVYFDSPTQGQQFRQIEDIGITEQTLILYPLASGAVAFDPLTRIYPCRACTRQNGQAEFEQASEATYMERLTFQTL